jgi:hypothetical protein
MPTALKNTVKLRQSDEHLVIQRQFVNPQKIFGLVDFVSGSALFAPEILENSISSFSVPGELIKLSCFPAR